MSEVLILLVFLSSAFFSFILNRVLIRFSGASSVSGRGAGNEERWSSQSKPTVGGISFFLTFVLSALVLFITFGTSSQFATFFLALTVVSTLGFLLGLQDDAYSTKPVLKFAGQISCGIIMVISGNSIDLFHVPVLDYGLTIFWVAGIMNSVNLLDNMDGVTGTVSFSIIGSIIMIIALFTPGYDPFFYSLVAVAGALLGFLTLNWKPSKLYMGDTGSQFLGAFLAFMGIRYLWNITALDMSVVSSMQIIAPIMAFLVPIMDTSFVTVSRIARGQSPFIGGRDHLTHNLTYIGVAEAHVPVVLGLVSLFSGLLAVFSEKYILQWNHWYTGIFIAYITLVFTIFAILYLKGQRIARIQEAWRKRKKVQDGSRHDAIVFEMEPKSVSVAAGE